MQPKESPGQSMQFLEVGPETPMYLGPRQNIVDQPPFSTLPEAIRLPMDLLRQPRITAIALFVRESFMTPSDWALVLEDKQRRRLGIPSNKVPMLELYHKTALTHLRTFPFMERYLSEYWLQISDIFDLYGNPREKQHRNKPIHPLTFAAFQATKRGELYIGLSSLLPTLETKESIRSKIGQGKSRVNRTWRVVREVTGNKG